MDMRPINLKKDGINRTILICCLLTQRLIYQK